MKANRKFIDDECGVAEQVGTSILLAITVASSGVIGAGITAWGFSVRDMSDSQSQQNSEQTKNNLVATSFIKNATEYILGYKINNPGNGGNGGDGDTDPHIDWNTTGSILSLTLEHHGYTYKFNMSTITGELELYGGGIIPPTEQG